MYPLDAVYGPKAYRTFLRERGFPTGLKDTLQSSSAVWADEPLEAESYEELIEIVSFISIMNKRHTLFFRGQGQHLEPLPGIFRRRWRSLSGQSYELPPEPKIRQRIWEHLGGRIYSIVQEVCSQFPMPRPATLRMFREAVWAVAQHYELWPTPLIDVTPNLRVAASFALLGGNSEGNLYVAALVPSTNSVTFDADQHIVLARLQAVCPPVAKRPHYQDGFLVGRFPFANPNRNEIDRDPDKVSRLSRRLLARIILKNRHEHDREGSAANQDTFWNQDFPAMSPSSLLPSVDNDQLLNRFLSYADEIDGAMLKISQDR